MEIHLEAAHTQAIQAYSEQSIQIHSISYERSLIVSATEIISDLRINTIQDMDLAYLDLILRFKPKIILIGHGQSGTFPPIDILQTVSQKGIGLECMSIGAACRTFNVLLSEQREVVAGFIMQTI